MKQDQFFTKAGLGYSDNEINEYVSKIQKNGFVIIDNFCGR